MDVFQQIQKISEAYCISKGIPINRRFSDEELVDAKESLDEANKILDSMEIENVQEE